MSTLNVSNITDGTTTVGTSYVVNGSAKAWVNFNGTGTIAIREGFNESSLTDEGTGDYTVNFTAAMTDVNYCTHVTPDSNSKTQAAKSPTIYSLGTTSSIRVSLYNNAAGAYQDSAVVNVSVIR